jgi:hypothetical protein
MGGFCFLHSPASEEEAAGGVFALADGRMKEKEYAAFVRANTKGWTCASGASGGDVETVRRKPFHHRGTEVTEESALPFWRAFGRGKGSCIVVESSLGVWLTS